jgi:hypothetical protein
MTARPTRLLPAAALAATCLLLVPATASAAWGPTVLLRSAPTGTDARVASIAASGSNVVVGWDEDGPSVDASYVRWSNNGGSSFLAHRRLDNRATREVDADVCGNVLHSAFGLRTTSGPPHKWLVAVEDRFQDGQVIVQGVVTTTGVARHPDVACVGTRRIVVAWLQRVGSSWRLKLFSRAAVESEKGANPPHQSFDLGTAELDGEVSVAATNDRVYVTWLRNDELRVKRFNVGAGVNALLSPLPTQVIADQMYQLRPKIAAGGSRVVLAWTLRADLVARVSENRGASFHPRRTLEDVPFPSEVAAYATNADVSGNRIIVSAYVIGYTGSGFAGEGWIERTTNDGDTWSRVAGTTRNGGTALGAYKGSGTHRRVVEAWDEWIADPATDDLRFRRQT